MKAKFIDVMLLLRTDRLPAGQEWLYEIKLDGYRALAIKTSGKLQLRSRNDNDFTQRYPSIAAGLQKMPDETVIDGEIVALDEQGHPSFNMLQNYGSSKAPLIYYIFDVLLLAGQNVMEETLNSRKALLGKKILPKVSEPIRYSSELEADLPSLIAAVKQQGFEGLLAKRRNSRYEPDRRLAQDARQSGAGTGHCRLYTIAKKLRCARDRLLRRWQADLCGAYP
jgi:ATP-dependent DNA ligase